MRWNGEMIYLDVEKEIERKRRRLHESIEKNGINSKETRKISIEVDNLLNEYYNKVKQYNEGNTMIVFYEKSLKELKDLMLDLGGFPNIKLWNEYALKNNCLNSASLEYISGLNWHKLEKKIRLELIKKS